MGIDVAVDLMLDLEVIITDKSFVGQAFAVGEKTYEVEKADNFEYTDPVDGSVTRNQVPQILCVDRSPAEYHGKSH